MKRQASKLDGVAAELREWFGAGMTLADAREKLKADHGLDVSVSRLSVWWEDEQEAQMRQRLLAQITNGAQASKEIEQEYRKNPAPELETLIKLVRTLVLQASSNGTADPNWLRTVPDLIKTALEFEKGRRQERELALAENRFRRETCELILKAAGDARAQEIAGLNVSNAEKIALLRKHYFKDVDEYEAAGKLKLPE